MMEKLSINKFYLNRSHALSYIKNLTVSDSVEAMTIYTSRGADNVTKNSKVLTVGKFTIPEEIITSIQSSKTGASLFLVYKHGVAVIPPFPVTTDAVFADYETEPLVNLLEKNYIIGLILLHLGSYAVALCKGEEVIEYKTGTGLIHGRQRQGGSSSKRFVHRRENQIAHFLKRISEHIKEIILSREKELDYLIYGGPRMTVKLLQQECPSLLKMENKVLSRIDVPALNLTELEKTLKRIWSSLIIEW